MSLRVTNIRIVPSQKDGKLKAFVDITFNDTLVCRGWKVIHGSNGLFVAPPSQKSGENFYDNILFVDATKKGSAGDKMRQHVQAEVLKAFGGTQKEAQEFNQTAGPVYNDELPF